MNRWESHSRILQKIAGILITLHWQLQCYQYLYSPLKHPFFLHFMTEFGLIVRQGHDFGQEGKSVTPEPESIMKNIETFLDRWNSIQYKGSFILTNCFQQEISNLKVQVMKRCLSYIPPKMGTNTNECIHKSMKSLLGRKSTSCKCNIHFAFLQPQYQKRIWLCLSNMGNVSRYLRSKV